MALQETLKNTVIIKSGAVPATTDVVAITDPILLSPKVKTGKSDAIGAGSLASSTGYVDNSDVTAEFSVSMELRSPVTLGTACEASNLFKISGLAETLTATTKAEYKLGGITSSGTGQAKVYNDGFSRLVTGMSASMKISGKIGEPVKVSFDTKGVTTAAAGAETNPVVTLNAGSKIIMSKANTVVTVSGTTLSIMDFELDLGAKVERSYTSNTNEFYIENYEPKLSITFVKTKTTDENAWTQLAAGGQSVISITVGSTGNQLVIDAAKAFSDSVDESDDRGRVTMKRAFTLENGGTANNNFLITLK
ncbi:MAG: hypothetical protein M0P91_05225 [Sulfuricurvum sp.]|jgi:hypothetical protein|uniref:hypothetical protein n=1 Tax=Sulfuricurvum sp. TaxID=2025608 RepID=UPI0025F2291A|nr:hypothetical protein [Sulfuricurvum sp.]MCK9372577.1 hypothetical protein [Sulfuricurvum sp.]